MRDTIERIREKIRILPVEQVKELLKRYKEERELKKLVRYVRLPRGTTAEQISKMPEEEFRRLLAEAKVRQEASGRWRWSEP